MQKDVIFVKEESLKNLSKSVNYWKARGHGHYRDKYRDAAHSICNLKFSLPNEMLVVFHNVSNYDYHFIIEELSK